MNLLALDQSTLVSGWSVFIDKKLIEYGHWSITDDEIGMRLYKLQNYIIDTVKTHNIDTIALEDIQLQGNNPQTFKKLAQVQGMIITLAHALGVDYYIVPSSTWRSTLKLTVRGKRPALKKEAQEYIYNKYNVQVTQDEADSICIGTHMCIDPRGSIEFKQNKKAPWAE